MTARGPVPPQEPSGTPQEKPRSGAAEDRLAAALRENLKRRKAQERARDAAAPKESPADEDR